MTRQPCCCPYDYGNDTHEPLPMPDHIYELGKHLAFIFGYEGAPGSCNFNLYEGPSSSLGWHEDNEPILTNQDGSSIVISYSLGASRPFQIRKKHSNSKPITVTLSEHDVLNMDRKTQLYFEHRVPSLENTFSVLDPRLNMTFRYVIVHSKACPLVNNS